MKPQFKSERAKKYYRTAKITLLVLLTLYVIALAVITVVAAVDGGMLASPVWGLFAVIGSLPLFLPIAATWFFVRRVLALKTNPLPQKLYAFELRFAIAAYVLLWLAAIFVVLWLWGIYQFMYAAIGAVALLLSMPLLRLLLTAKCKM